MTSFNEPQERFSVDQIAQICHEANRQVQISIGEVSSPYWKDAPDWQKDSAREGVLHALRGESAEELHLSWVWAKIRDGWTYGPVKDEEKKTHPCLVPYHELPRDQQIKDHVFRGIVEVFASVDE